MMQRYDSSTMLNKNLSSKDVDDVFNYAPHRGHLTISDVGREQAWRKAELLFIEASSEISVNELPS